MSNPAEWPEGAPTGDQVMESLELLAGLIELGAWDRVGEQLEVVRAGTRAHVGAMLQIVQHVSQRHNHWHEMWQLGVRENEALREHHKQLEAKIRALEGGVARKHSIRPYGNSPN